MIKGSVEITNTGDQVAQEVVQVYIRDLESSVQRPEQELKDFHKVLLEPGESRRVEIELSSRSFSFWDIQTHNWKLEPGDFEIRVGASSRDIRLSSVLSLT
jgi:beta-glucosidase